MKDMISDMWREGGVSRLLLFFFAFVIMLFPLLIWTSIEEQRRWETFAVEHDCKVVGKIRGSVSSGIGHGFTASGQTGPVVITTTTPDRTGYLCDDGITYWR